MEKMMLKDDSGIGTLDNPIKPGQIGLLENLGKLEFHLELHCQRSKLFFQNTVLHGHDMKTLHTS